MMVFLLPLVKEFFLWQKVQLEQVHEAIAVEKDSHCDEHYWYLLQEDSHADLREEKVKKYWGLMQLE